MSSSGERTGQARTVSLGPSGDDLHQRCQQLATWRKSSWSSYNGNCVEVAELGGLLIGVRDTKDAGVGPVLVFGHAAWRSFLDGVKNGG